MQVAGVAHSALEYYRWAVRSQVRAEGRRFAAAVARPPTAPVLQVHGADDPYLMAGTAEASRRWGGPHLRCELLPATGHFPHAERPAATASLLLDFLPR
jgi:pimeloyl-ACP methyl ester carboxylesterase